MIDTPFAQTNVNFTTNSFTGDYTNFQVYFENTTGPHPESHIILGGDMSEFFPFGLEPRGCYAGMK